MPSIEDFKKSQNAKGSGSKSKKASSGVSPSSGKKARQRRPGRDSAVQEPSKGEFQAQVEVVEVDSLRAGAETGSSGSSHSAQGQGSGSGSAASSAAGSGNSGSFGSGSGGTTGSEHEPEAPPRVEVSFYGSELLRARFPQPFNLVEQIATDWVHDGRFEGLPVGHPLLQVAASQGLRRAKELEKEILESPKTEKIVTDLFTAAMNLQVWAQKISGALRGKR